MIIWRIMRRFYHKVFCQVTETIIGGVSSKFYTPELLDRYYINIITGTDQFGEKMALNSFISSLRDGWIVWDIGADIGSYTIPSAIKVGTSGKVMAFEPLHENVRRIYQNAEVNNLNNIEVVEAAVGSKSSKGILYYVPEEDGKVIDHTSSKVTKPTDWVRSSERTVAIVSGNEMIKTHLVPNAIKIDVEGYEYEVINGMLDVLHSPECKVVLCEVHTKLLPVDVDLEWFKDKLSSCGFVKIEKFPNREHFHLLCKK